MWTTEYVQQLPSPPPHLLSQSQHESQYLFEGQGPRLETDQVPAQQVNPQQQQQLYRHPVLEYTKATGLLPIIEALGGESSDHCQTYLDEYDRLLQEAYPILKLNSHHHQQHQNSLDSKGAAGKYITLMPFKRMFIVCRM